MKSTGKLVLDWNLDDASQDGYLHTRSFPLSLGDNQEFAKIKELREPLIIQIDNDSSIIVAISREKYPGKINSIGESSKNYLILKSRMIFPG